MIMMIMEMGTHRMETKVLATIVLCRSKGICIIRRDTDENEHNPAEIRAKLTTAGFEAYERQKYFFAARAFVFCLV